MEINFNLVNSLPSTVTKGDVYFDKSTKTIAVADSDSSIVLFGGGGKKVEDVSSGVFIIDSNKLLYTTTEYTTFKTLLNITPSGVAVITPEHSFVIAPVSKGTKRICKNGDAFYNDSTSVSKDVDLYNGETNTTNIINAKSGSNDNGAAEACRSYTFAHGKSGYLPSYAELKLAYQNRTNIETAMSAIGGTSISGLLWSSTQSSPAETMISFDWDDNYIYYTEKDFYNNRTARPFASI